MKNYSIEINNLSKAYDLGVISSGTLSKDFSSIISKLFGKQDPNSKIDSNDLKSSTKSSKVWALRNIDLKIEAGDIVGIVGKNGAGKSTLLKILSRITIPTIGSIKIKGRLSSLLEVGTGFHPELTGRENIFLNGAILGMKKSEIKTHLESIISFSGVGKYIDTPIKRYSSGMNVRLAFSVAAHLESDILLIDEVLAVGDASFQEKCLGKIEDISKLGRTVLFVSHNMDAIKGLCKSCVLLERGELVQKGETSSVISNYLQKYEINEIINYSDNFSKIKNNIISLKSVRLIDKSGNLINSELNDLEFGIEINFEILDNGKKIFPSINFYNNQGMHLMTSVQRNLNGITKQGKFKTIVWIPVKIFSNGYFNVAILFFASNIYNTERILQTNQILRFKIFDKILSEIKGQVDLNIPSALIPEFNWETDIY